MKLTISLVKKIKLSKYLALLEEKLSDTTKKMILNYEIKIFEKKELSVLKDELENQLTILENKEYQNAP